MLGGQGVMGVGEVDGYTMQLGREIYTLGMRCEGRGEGRKENFRKRNVLDGLRIIWL